MIANQKMIKEHKSFCNVPLLEAYVAHLFVSPQIGGQLEFVLWPFACPPIWFDGLNCRRCGQVDNIFLPSVQKRTELVEIGGELAKEIKMKD